ncbi:FK506-binding protein 2 [Penicillium atrosanguineum]|nr:FK506-binding protein 2 [Penicillium atrosanguineum]
MRLTTIFLSLASLACAAELGIEVTHEVECTRKTKNGDGVQMHYRGTLQDSGKEFDSSFKRNVPLSFKLGTGRVIKGVFWTCALARSALSPFPPEYGYGDRGVGPIPGGATLIFETELVGIEGVDKDEL